MTPSSYPRSGAFNQPRAIQSATRQNRDAVRAPDLVNRDFTADRPDALWVTDLTYVATRTGMAYVCFITDAFSRRIVGWRVASHMRTEMVLDALEMARRSRGTRLEGLIAHTDTSLIEVLRPPIESGQFTSIRYGERLAEIGAVPSIGSVGDSYDNALAESVNGLYETELIRGPGRGPWRTVDDIELATLGWFHWSRYAGDPQQSRRRPARRIRSRLRCLRGQPGRDWNPTNRACAKPRANQAAS